MFSFRPALRSPSGTHSSKAVASSGFRLGPLCPRRASRFLALRAFIVAVPGVDRTEGSVHFLRGALSQSADSRRSLLQKKAADPQDA